MINAVQGFNCALVTATASAAPAPASTAAADMKCRCCQQKKAMMVHDASCTNEETFYFCSNRYSNMQEFELSRDCGLVFKFQFLVHFSCSKRTGGRTDVQRVRFSSTLFFPFNAFLRYKTNIFAFVMIVYSQRFFRIFFIFAVLHVCDICFGFVSDFSFIFFFGKLSVIGDCVLVFATPTVRIVVLLKI